MSSILNYIRVKKYSFMNSWYMYSYCTCECGLMYRQAEKYTHSNRSVSLVSAST